MTRQMTNQEIRKFLNHRKNGRYIHIRRDGKVSRRTGMYGPWVDCRWIEEYYVESDGTMRRE